MEEMDEGDYLSDCDEDDYYKNENKYIYRETNIIKKFNVTFYFEFNQKKKYVIPISTENLNVNDFYIYDLIRYIIKKINNSNINIKDSEANYSVSLKDIDEDNKDFYVTILYLINYFYLVLIMIFDLLIYIFFLFFLGNY